MAQAIGATEYLYHYTSKSALENIMNTGQLNASTNVQIDARHGKGIYFTQLGPRSLDEWLQTNNWDGARRITANNYSHYVRVGRGELENVANAQLRNRCYNEGGRVITIWVLETADDKPLNLRTVRVSYGHRVMDSQGKPHGEEITN